MNKRKILYRTLMRALTTARPHATATTLEFTEWLERNVPKHIPKDCVWVDRAGNLHVDNRTTDKHRTLFVAHVDTVHSKEGVNAIRKTGTHWYADGAQLGADDGAGCALLMHLLHADVKAYYIFTQGEERGGIGAKYLFDTFPKLLACFDRAIAFDRRGLDSIITHQGWGRCCSDLFGDALAEALNITNDNLMYQRDDTGIYTDTAEFVDIIPECTNISVGYLHEHTVREELNILHYQQLAAAVLSVDWDALPTNRDPSVPDPDDKWGKYDTSWYTTGTGLTGVKGYDSKTDSTWSGYLDPDSEAVLGALYDAKYGFKEELLSMAAEVAYPDDPKLARKHMKDSKLTDAILDDIIDAAEAFEYMNTDEILLDIYDTVYAN